MAARSVDELLTCWVQMERRAAMLESLRTVPTIHAGDRTAIATAYEDR